MGNPLRRLFRSERSPENENQRRTSFVVGQEYYSTKARQEILYKFEQNEPVPLDAAAKLPETVKYKCYAVDASGVILKIVSGTGRFNDMLILVSPDNVSEFADAKSYTPPVPGRQK